MKRDYPQEILKLLSEKQMYITEIAEALNTTRITVDKYVTLLEAKGLIVTERIGYLKLCRVVKNE